MEEWRKQREQVWGRLQGLATAGPLEKYHLKDVFLKLRFEKFDVGQRGDIILHGDLACLVQPASPCASLSQQST